MNYQKYPSVSSADIKAADAYKEELREKIRAIWDHQQAHLPPTLHRSCDIESRHFANQMKTNKMFCDAVLNNRMLAFSIFAQLANYGLTVASGPQEVYLTAFGGKPGLIIGWRGFVKLATCLYGCSEIETGPLHKDQSSSVTPGEPLSVPKMTFKAGQEKTQEMVGSWAQCQTASGRWIHHVMTPERIANVKAKALELWKKSGDFAAHSIYFKSFPDLWMRKAALRQFFTQVITQQGARITDAQQSTVNRVLDIDAFEGHKGDTPRSRADLEQLVRAAQDEHPDARGDDLMSHVLAKNELTNTQIKVVGEICAAAPDAAPQVIDALADEDDEDDGAQTTPAADKQPAEGVI